MEKVSKETLTNIVGTRLKELRKAKTDLGQKDVADDIGITKQALSNYESGRNLPDHAVLVSLAKYYSCTTDYLYGLTDETTQKVTNYSERECVNSMFHAMETVSEDEADYIVSTTADALKELSISKKNPQRRGFIELWGEWNLIFTEYIEYITLTSRRLSKSDITPEDIAKVSALFYSKREIITEIAESIQQLGFSAILNFSSISKKKLRVRKNFRKGLNNSNFEREC